VHDINEMYKEFEKSTFIDCRINAFPLIENPVPNFIFINLDKNDDSKISLEVKLEYTLTNIKKRLGGHPLCNGQVMVTTYINPSTIH